jgi:hypothetical protein
MITQIIVINESDKKRPNKQTMRIQRAKNSNKRPKRRAIYSNEFCAFPLYKII